MALRVYQTTVDVVGEPPQTGEVRLHRLYASVLVQISGTQNLTTLMALTDVAAVTTEKPQSVSDPISFVSAGTFAKEIALATTSTLAFVTSAGPTVEAAPSQTVTFISVGSAFNLVGDRSPAGNVLAFTDSATTEGLLQFSTHNLSITDSATVYNPILHHSALSTLALSDAIPTSFHMWAADTLYFISQARVPITYTLTSTMNLTHLGDVTFIDDILAFTQTATWGFAIDVEDTFSVVDTAEVEGLWVRSLTTTLGIGHILSWYEDTACGRKQYTPFVGENTMASAVTPPADTMQDTQGSLTDRLSLYQPSLGSRLLEVVLRAPEMDNRDRNAYNRVNRETRGGKLTMFADPIWPKVRTLAVTVTGLKTTEKDEYQTFLAATLGQEIGLTDWEGRLWEGVVINPDEPASQDGNERWTISFEFEGAVLTTEQPGGEDGSAMAFTQVASAVIV